MELKKGETIMIDAALHLPVSFLHEAFSDRSGVPLALFELYYRGKRLEGEAALASLGVEKGSTIEVKMRGRGGGNTERKRPQKPDEGSSSLSNLHPEQVPLGTEPSSPKTPSQGNAEKKLLQNTKDASEEVKAAEVAEELAATAIQAANKPSPPEGWLSWGAAKIRLYCTTGAVESGAESPLPARTSLHIALESLSIAPHTVHTLLSPCTPHAPNESSGASRLAGEPVAAEASARH